jgi:hypothetical protein
MTSKYAHILPWILVAGAALGCGPSIPTGGDTQVGDPDDAAVADTPMGMLPDVYTPMPPDGTPGTIYDDADLANDGGCPGTTCPMPVDDGCVGSEGCGADGSGNGTDDDCDGVVDEGCFCTPGDVRPCFRGQPGRRGVGACVDGTMRCEGDAEFPEWGACTGGIWPTTETCDTQDNNCNGCADDNPDCCVVEIACPGPGDLPDAAPFTPYTIDGTMFYSGPAMTWSWTVVGGPCDQLLSSTSGTTSYTLTGASSSAVTFTPTLSGDYTFTMTVTAPDGTTYTCTFIVHVVGPGLRVELCWDTTGDADIDLHLHRAGTTTNWFGSISAPNADDCSYLNCRASDFLFGFDAAEWGYADTALAECSGTSDGATWSLYGGCHNPRLDIDNISTEGIPENINVDNPNDGQTFRPMVHYYGGSIVTHPMVNIYCGGVLTATYGAAPDLVPSFNSGGGFGSGPMWRVADVTVHVTGGVTTGCDVTALHPMGSTTGYLVTTGSDTSY